MADDDNKNDESKREAKKTLVGIGSEAPPAESEDRAEATSEAPKRRIKKTLVGVGALAAPSSAEIAKDAEEKADAAKADEAKAMADEADELAAQADELAAKAKADEEEAEAKAAAKAKAAEAEAKAEAEAAAAAEEAAGSSSDDPQSGDDANEEAPARAKGDDDSDDDDDHDGGGGDDGHDEEDGDEPETRVALYLAEYETPDQLVHAAEAVRDAGYQKWDCHTPYPMHGLDDAMGLRPTKIGLISFAAAMTGLITAVLMIQYMNNWDYPINIGGKPVGAGGFPAMVPIMFELTILLCGFGTLFGMLHLAKLPRHHHPIFESERFESASDDKFFISVEVADDKFDVIKTRELLEATSPSFLELVEEEVP